MARVESPYPRHLWTGIALAVVGTVLLVLLVLPGSSRCPSDGELFLAFLPGVIEVEAEAEIRLYDRCVGRVEAVRPGEVAVRIQVERAPHPALAFGATLPVSHHRSDTVVLRDPSLFSDSIVVSSRYEGGGPAIRARAGDEVVTARTDPAGRWVLDRAGATGSPGAGGDPAAAPDQVGTPSDRFRLASATLSLGSVAAYTRVRLMLGADRIRETLEDEGIEWPGDLEAMVDARSILQLGGTADLAGIAGRARTFDLQPSFRGDARVRRPPEGGDPPSGELEGVSTAGIDQSITGFARFAASPSGQHLPPSSRLERLVDDLGATAEKLNGFASAIDSVSDAGADAVLGRLVFGAGGVADIQGALANLGAVAHEVDERLQSVDENEPLLAALILHETTRDSLETTLQRAAPFLAALDDSTRTLMGRVDSLVIRADSVILSDLVPLVKALAEKLDQETEELADTAGGAARTAGIFFGVAAVAKVITTLLSIF